jgi:hypothetical protein
MPAGSKRTKKKGKSPYSQRIAGVESRETDARGAHRRMAAQMDERADQRALAKRNAAAERRRRRQAERESAEKPVDPGTTADGLPDA